VTSREQGARCTPRPACVVETSQVQHVRLTSCLASIIRTSDCTVAGGRLQDALPV